MFAINLTALLPLRKDADEGAEQLTQILFGELFYVVEQMDRWSKIRNVADNYEGWVDSKMITRLDQLEFTRLLHAPIFYTNEPVVDAVSGEEIIKLPMGAFLRGYDPESGLFSVDHLQYKVSPNLVSEAPAEKNVNYLMSIAYKFKNAPYLWGGKSIFGLDCSGLTQISCRLSGIILPRDARQQIQHGQVINTLEEAHTGDLLFFATSDNKVKHVGIYVHPGKLLHASGYVHEDQIDESGNILSEITTYVHYHLAGIRRFIV
ncbi:MAG: NlpC/P60 family protein [Bacteroidales bacterium]